MLVLELEDLLEMSTIATATGAHAFHVQTFFPPSALPGYTVTGGYDEAEQVICSQSSVSRVGVDADGSIDFQSS